MIDLALHAVAGMDGHFAGQVVPGGGADGAGGPGHAQAANGFGLQVERRKGIVQPLGVRAQDEVRPVFFLKE